MKSLILTALLLTGCAHLPLLSTPMSRLCSGLCEADPRADGHMAMAAYDTDADECVCMVDDPLTHNYSLWRIPAFDKRPGTVACR